MQTTRKNQEAKLLSLKNDYIDALHTFYMLHCPKFVNGNYTGDCRACQFNVIAKCANPAHPKFNMLFRRVS